MHLIKEVDRLGKNFVGMTAHFCFLEAQNLWRLVIIFSISANLTSRHFDCS